MAPVIDIIRHAEARNNVEGSHIRDPDLTPHGFDQCDSLRKSYPSRDKVSCIVASPMKRTIQTALFGFPDLIEHGKKIIAIPELQENSARPSDTGSPLPELKEEYDPYVDWVCVSETWFLKGPDTRFAPVKEKVEERARIARLGLRELARRVGPDGHIVVVTHGAFGHFLTQDFLGLRPGKGSGVFRHARVKSYEFADLDGQDDQATLVLSEEERRKTPGPHWVDLDEPEKSKFKGYALERLQRHASEAKWFQDIHGC
ncbi:histidine phosphatase superfamily [Biscogniauxia mediterranea]|nr:histidine phosphatase superfamily [Biscogniauxia mediterranea]